MTPTRFGRLFGGVVALPVAALAIAACGSSGGGSSASSTPAPPTNASGASVTVGTASSGSLGSILVNSQGRTLYLFQGDKGTTSNCNGACATAWPPATATGAPTGGSGVTASLLGTTTRSDGTTQVTYNGHPLYRFSGDPQPGNTNGQGVNAFGALWYAVSPSGNQASSGSSSSSSSSLGY
jgi:predicted lipoprotein with Yx(FWY)xxD motif